MDELLDQRLELFPLIRQLPDPKERDKAYGVIRDAGSKESLEKIEKRLRERLFQAEKVRLTEETKEIKDGGKRLKAVRAIAEASSPDRLRKIEDRIEVVLLEETQ